VGGVRVEGEVKREREDRATSSTSSSIITTFIKKRTQTRSALTRTTSCKRRIT
jgi:hypothetical protein